MRILFIDDEPIRAKPFLDAGYDVFITDDVEAIELYLEQHQRIPFDLVCLDHDFENRQYTGASVAREQLAHQSIPVVVHSCNPAGAESIMANFGEYGVVYTLIPCYDGWFDKVMEWFDWITSLTNNR
jgi:CheY-like chemotaxis protein